MCQRLVFWTRSIRFLCNGRPKRPPNHAITVKALLPSSHHHRHTLPPEISLIYYRFMVRHVKSVAIRPAPGPIANNNNNSNYLLFSRLYNVSTSSCAHLTIILSSSSIYLCHSSLLPLIPFLPSLIVIMIIIKTKTMTGYI